MAEAPTHGTPGSQLERLGVGLTAWLLWLLIHIAYLIGFADRIVVVTRWAFSFLSHGRGTRLITGGPLLPEIHEPDSI